MSSAEVEVDKMGRQGGFEKAREERDALKAKVAELQQDALNYHNTIAERETQNEILEARIKSLEEAFKSEHKTLKENIASSAKEATEADDRAREANKELQKLKEQLEAKDEKIQEYKVIVTDMQSDQNNKETERRQLQAQLNDAEARLRGLEEKSMRDEEELEKLRMELTLVKDRLGQLLTNWGKDITSDNVLAYIDEIEESRLPKASSQVSLSTAFENGARAKGGDRKISMSDELDKAAELMDDDRGEGEEMEINGAGPYIEELEKRNIALLEDNSNLRAGIEALEKKELEKGTTSPQIDTPTMAMTKTTADQSTTKTVEKPVERPATLSDLFFKAPRYMKLLLLVLVIGYVWSYYLTWTERRMWLDANEKPWLSSEIYHGYMARQSESIFPLFTIESGPWVEWIEYEVLGYLRVMPG